MKNILLAIVLTSVLFVGCSDEKREEVQIENKGQVTLFDKNKEGVAYIDYDDEYTIYLFDGKPVAYLVSEEKVYGFNGKFLGWYFDGVLYDNKSGYAVGAKHGVEKGEINTIVTHVERIKGVKYIKPIKHIKSTAPTPLVPKYNWADITLLDFLSQGGGE